MKKNILSFILGLLVASSIGVYASYKYNASDISYKDTDVESAVNDLYYKIPAKIELGKTYKMGGYEWICAELLNGGCVMQSTGMTVGAWPGYKLTSNYEGTESYGNANTNYTSNIDGDNIANYDDKTSTFYNSWKSVELKNINYGKGLFLVSKEKCGFTEDHKPGSGNYYDGLVVATTNPNMVGKQFPAAWLGTYTGGVNYSNYLNIYETETEIALNSGVAYIDVIAPAFNLDTSKVYLDGTTIKKK